MKKEIAEAWVKDLRTNPPQAFGKLYDGHGYCCLGRLCLVLGAEFKAKFKHGVKYYPHLDGQNTGEDEVLPEVFQQAAGMQSRGGRFTVKLDEYDYREDLTGLNDKGRTFSEIADVIEKHWEEL